jgi:excisionase family DNA binding protein
MQEFHRSPNQVLPAVSETGENQRTFERLMSAEDAAALLGGIHVKTLQRKARLGEIPGYQIGRSWFFRESGLDAWLSSHIRLQPANTPA